MTSRTPPGTIPAGFFLSSLDHEGQGLCAARRDSFRRRFPPCDGSRRQRLRPFAQRCSANTLLPSIRLAINSSDCSISNRTVVGRASSDHPRDIREAMLGPTCIPFVRPSFFATTLHSVEDDDHSAKHRRECQLSNLRGNSQTPFPTGSRPKTTPGQPAALTEPCIESLLPDHRLANNRQPARHASEVALPYLEALRRGGSQICLPFQHATSPGRLERAQGSPQNSC